MRIEDKYNFQFSDYKDIDTSDEALEKKLDGLKNAESKEDKQLFKWLHSIYIDRQCRKQQPDVPSFIDNAKVIYADFIKYNLESKYGRLAGEIITDDEHCLLTVGEIEQKIINRHNLDIYAHSDISVSLHGIVVTETPLQGLVLKIGNQKNGQWEIVGTTCGYA